MTNKTRVFISFDFDNDSTVKDFLVGQSKHDDTPFEFADWSIKEHITGDWEKKARTRIKSVSAVCFLCGTSSHTSKGMTQELAIAQSEGIPYFFLAAYPDKTCYKPVGAKSDDKLYKWTWDNVKALIKGHR